MLCHFFLSLMWLNVTTQHNFIVGRVKVDWEMTSTLILTEDDFDFKEIRRQPQFTAKAVAHNLNVKNTSSVQ